MIDNWLSTFRTSVYPPASNRRKAFHDTIHAGDVPAAFELYGHFWILAAEEGLEAQCADCLVFVDIVEVG